MYLNCVSNDLVLYYSCESSLISNVLYQLSRHYSGDYTLLEMNHIRDVLHLFGWSKSRTATST